MHHEKALAALLALWLPACAGPEAAPDEQAKVRLIGKPVSNAVALLGPDYRTEPREAGGALYRWTLIEDLLEPGNQGPPALGVSRRGTATYQGGKRSAPRLVSQKCDVTLEAEPSGSVSGWRVEGEACIDILRARLR